MSTTAPTTAPSTGALWRTGVLAALTAGVAAMLVGLAGQALDVPMTVQQPGGEIAPVALPAYLIATLVATLLGTALATVLRTRASRPAATFVTVAVLLALASLVQPFLLAEDVATAVTLALSHVIAAAAAIPWLARALPRHR